MQPETAQFFKFLQPIKTIGYEFFTFFRAD